jgi:hypothetical protein
MKVQIRSIVGEERKQDYEVDTIQFDCCGWTGLQNDTLIFSILDIGKVIISNKDDTLTITEVDSVQ